MRLNQLSLIGTGVLSLGIYGCPFFDTTSNTARLRVVHASPDAPAVDVCAGGAVAFADAAFPAATAYAEVDAGSLAVRVVPADAGCDSAGVIDATLTLNAGDELTVVAVNALANIEPLVLTDNNTAPASGNARVRFVHASPNAPTVDITLTDGTTLFNDISFKETGAYIEVAAGTYNLQVRDETGSAVVLNLNDIALANGKIYTVFAVGVLNGNPALNAFIATDN